MAYYLKKSKLKRGLYLQCYFNFYDPEKKGTRGKSIKAYGYLEDLKKTYPDPIAHFQNEIDEMNREFQLKKQKASSEDNKQQIFGHFPLKSLHDSLDVHLLYELLGKAYGLKFDLYELVSSLIYARFLEPCSKSRTLHKVLPKLYPSPSFSEDRVYQALEFLGMEYKRIIEGYSKMVSFHFGTDTSLTYFDCTNYYFEIDKEDSLRRKGPSKENRKDPIVGMGILLDSQHLPLAMHVYPGNQSEQPVLREVLDDLRKTHELEGKVVRVVDKGLNSAANIFDAVKHGDGYIFSKSVKMLPETEIRWIELEQDYKTVSDSEGHLLFKYKDCVDDFPYQIQDEDGKKRTIHLREKRVVSFNPALATKKKAELLKEVEKALAFTRAKAKRKELGDLARLVSFRSVDKNGKLTNNDVAMSLNEDYIDRELRLAGYNLIVTSEVQKSAKDIYDAYHRLWCIEETFRVMKSQLQARPVYLQKHHSIVGHFLICYIGVLLLRLFQIKVLDKQFSSEAIFDFIRSAQVMNYRDLRFINSTPNSPLAQYLVEKKKLPLLQAILSQKQLDSLFKLRF